MTNLLIKSSIRIKARNREEAEVICRALKPDDEPLPEGLQVSTYTEGDTVVAEIVCSRGFLSFLATVDDVLRMAAVSEKVLETTARGHRDI